MSTYSDKVNAMPRNDNDENPLFRADRSLKRQRELGIDGTKQRKGGGSIVTSASNADTFSVRAASHYGGISTGVTDFKKKGVFMQTSAASIYKNKTPIRFCIRNLSEYYVESPYLKALEESDPQAYQTQISDRNGEERMKPIHESLRKLVENLVKIQQVNVKSQNKICESAGFVANDCVTSLLANIPATQGTSLENTPLAEVSSWPHTETADGSKKTCLQVLVPNRIDFTCEIPLLEIDRVFKTAMADTITQLFRVWSSCVVLNRLSQHGHGDDFCTHFTDAGVDAEVLDKSKTPFDLETGSKSIVVETMLNRKDLLSYFQPCEAVAKEVQAIDQTEIAEDDDDEIQILKEWIKLRYVVVFTKCETDELCEEDSSCRISILPYFNKTSKMAIERLIPQALSDRRERSFEEKRQTDTEPMFYDLKKVRACDVNPISINSVTISQKRPICTVTTQETAYMIPNIHQADLLNITNMQTLEIALNYLKDYNAAKFGNRESRHAILSTSADEVLRLTFERAWLESIYQNDDTFSFPLPRIIRIALNTLQTLRQRVDFLDCFEMPHLVVQSHVQVFEHNMNTSQGGDKGLLTGQFSTFLGKRTPRAKFDGTTACPLNRSNNEAINSTYAQTLLNVNRVTVFMCAVAVMLSFLKDRTINRQKEDWTSYCSGDCWQDTIWYQIYKSIQEFQGCTLNKVSDIQQIRNMLLDLDREALSPVVWYLRSETATVSRRICGESLQHFLDAYRVIIFRLAFPTSETFTAFYSNLYDHQNRLIQDKIFKNMYNNGGMLTSIANNGITMSGSTSTSTSTSTPVKKPPPPGSSSLTGFNKDAFDVLQKVAPNRELVRTHGTSFVHLFDAIQNIQDIKNKGTGQISSLVSNIMNNLLLVRVKEIALYIQTIINELYAFDNTMFGTLALEDIGVYFVENASASSADDAKAISTLKGDAVLDTSTHSLILAACKGKNQQLHTQTGALTTSKPIDLISPLQDGKFVRTAKQKQGLSSIALYDAKGVASSSITLASLNTNGFVLVVDGDCYIILADGFCVKTPVSVKSTGDYIALGTQVTGDPNDTLTLAKKHETEAKSHLKYGKFKGFQGEFP